MKLEALHLGWLLVVNAVYAVAAVVAVPLYLVLMATRRKYRHRPWQRWGFVPKFARLSAAGQRPAARKPMRLWVHAISVGEVEAARTFVPALAEAFSGAEIVLSTTTMTGRERAAKLFPGRPVFYFPLDLAPCVMLALARVRPTAVIQVESEWWPNFFLLARLWRVPVLAVNVRITEKSRRGYARIRGLMRAVFNSTAAIGVQAEVYRERLLALGAEADRIRVTGQMKHDAVGTSDTVAGAEDLAREAGIAAGQPVLVAGSTAPGEDDVLLAAYCEARRAVPDLRLVIVPRRPENFDAAAEAIRRAGLGLLRRSLGPGSAPEGAAGEPPVILGDTMGELMKWYALADIVFIGRSLVPLGGSNPMEPGSLARPLLWGPHMFNFPIEAPALIAAGAAREVTDAASLAAAVVDLLTRSDRRRQMGAAARQVIRSMQGATARSVALVREVLG